MTVPKKAKEVKEGFRSKNDIEFAFKAQDRDSDG